jgi:adenosylhomocysteine nucleosidase
MRRFTYLLSAVLVATLLSACGARDVRAPVEARRPIIVQGAMDAEMRKLAAALDHASEEHAGGWTFWAGTLDGAAVVVSKTMKGMSNAAAATALGAERYHPLAIVNQGTAGGHHSRICMSSTSCSASNR